jgi:hypothetical protein
MDATKLSSWRSGYPPISPPEEGAAVRRRRRTRLTEASQLRELHHGSVSGIYATFPPAPDAALPKKFSRDVTCTKLQEPSEVPLGVPANRDLAIDHLLPGRIVWQTVEMVRASIGGQSTPESRRARTPRTLRCNKGGDHLVQFGR